MTFSSASEIQHSFQSGTDAAIKKGGEGTLNSAGNEMYTGLESIKFNLQVP